MFYFYIIYSKTAGRFYIGHAADPWLKLMQHNTNSVEKYTGKNTDWELKAVFEVAYSKEEADQLEKFIKKQKSRKLVLKLIDPDFKPAGELNGLVRVSHVRD